MGRAAWLKREKLGTNGDIIVTGEESQFGSEP